MRASLFIGHQNPDRIGEYILWIESICEKLQLPLSITSKLDLTSNIIFFLDGDVRPSYLDELSRYSGRIVFLPTEWASMEYVTFSAKQLAYNSFTSLDKIYDFFIHIVCVNNPLACYQLIFFRGIFFLSSLLLRGITYRFQLNARTQFLQTLRLRSNVTLLFPDQLLRESYLDCAFTNPSALVYPIINDQTLRNILRDFLATKSFIFITTGRINNYRRHIIKKAPFPLKHIPNFSFHDGFLVNTYIPQSSSWFKPSVMRSYRAISNHTIPYDYGCILPDCFDFLKPPISLLLTYSDDTARKAWFHYVDSMYHGYVSTYNTQLSYLSSLLELSDVHD